MTQLDLIDQPGWHYNERKPLDRAPETMEHGHTIVPIAEVKPGSGEAREEIVPPCSKG